MSKKIKDANKPVGKMKKIKDFLPPPNELIMPKENIKVTISLSRSSVEFFKRQAKRHHVKYQRMIRQLIDRYATRYSRT